MTAQPHPTPGTPPSPAAPLGRGHMPHASPVTPSLHPSHHPAKSITQPEVTTPVTVSPPGRDITTPRSPGPITTRCFTRHTALASHPRQATPAGLTGPISTHFSHPRNWPRIDPSPRPSKTGQNWAEKTTAKICDTPQLLSSLKSLAIHPSTGPLICRLHKFVTPLRYEIPPFSLAQPRAKICDTPQIRNTPIFPGTALAPNESLFQTRQKGQNQPEISPTGQKMQKSAMYTAQKFVTPLSYEIPPFSLAQPRAKICDTPQLRNTPHFPGTAPRKNLVQL